MAFSELRALSTLSQTMPRQQDSSKADVAEWHEEKAAVLRQIAESEQHLADKLRREPTEERQ